MSMYIPCFLMYAIASTLITMLLISLCQHLLCPKINKFTLEPHDSNNNHRSRGASISCPPSVGNSNHSNHNPAQSVSSIGAVDIASIIPIPNDTSNQTTATNISVEKSRSNPSHTREDSYQIRASLPHAVSNLVHNIKGMLYKMEYKGYESDDIQLIVRILSITAVFAFLLCVIILCIHFIIKVTDDDIVTEILCLILYIIGKFSLYLCSVWRLYYSLEGGIYEYSIIIYALITIYLIIDFIIVISAILLLIYIASFYLFIKCILIFYFMDIFYLILLYILFTKQLISLIKNTSTYITTVLPNKNKNIENIAIELQISSSPSPSTVSVGDIIESDSNNKSNKSKHTSNTKDNAYIHKHKISGIEYVTKYSVLILWSVISSLLMIIILSILNTDFILQFNKNIIIHIILSMDCIINSFTIYLYFIFGRGTYTLLCGVCHNITSTICDKFIF